MENHIALFVEKLLTREILRWFLTSYRLPSLLAFQGESQYMDKRLVLRQDCRHFRGSKPCIHNKLNGYECQDCAEYSQVDNRVLIIKLDAIGDVLRTLSILPPLRKKHKNPYVVWITRSQSVEIVRACPYVDEVWEYDVEALSKLHVMAWDCVYGLSNDSCSSALTAIAEAKEKVGFLLSRKGIITPTNKAAAMWLTLAVFDRVKKQNELSYQKIMYDICGFSEPISKPRLLLPDNLKRWAGDLLSQFMPLGEKTIIGVNTGSGRRWPKKMLDTKETIKVIKGLLGRKTDCWVLLLGGPDEVAKNEEIAGQVSSDRLANMGCNHTLLQFSAIMKQCDVIFCGDTLALHIATALGVPALAVFGPTSLTEIYDYEGLIDKVHAEGLDCLCCYSDCRKGDDCMSVISIEYLIERIIAKAKVDVRPPKSAVAHDSS